MLSHWFSHRHSRMKLPEMCWEKSLNDFLQEPWTFDQTLPTTDSSWGTIVLLWTKNNPLISVQTNGSSLPAAGSLVSCRSCSNCKSLPKKQACPHPRTRGATGGASERDWQIRPINSEEVEFTAAPAFPSPDCPPKPGLNFMPEIRRSKATL